MGNVLEAATALSPNSDIRAGEVLRLRREIGRMQRRRSEHPVLPLDPALTDLLPDGGLATGVSYTVSSSPSLVLALLAAASAKGHWCAVIGMPTLGVEAAAGFGIDLSRLILVPEPGERWLAVASALTEVVPLIVVQPTSRVGDAEVSRLSARLRDRGTTLLVTESVAMGAWPQSEGRIRLREPQWHGLGTGWGLLSDCAVTVTAETRRSPAPSNVRVLLPGRSGAVESVAPAVAAPVPLRPEREIAPAVDHPSWAVAG